MKLAEDYNKGSFVEDYVRYNVICIIDNIIIVRDSDNACHVGGEVVDRGFDKNGNPDIYFILNSIFTGDYFEKVIVRDPIRAGVRTVNTNTGEITNDMSSKAYWYSWCKLSGLYKKSRKKKTLITKDSNGYFHMKLN